MNIPLVLTGGYDHKLVFWSAVEARPVRIVPHTKSQINCMTAAPDQQLVTVAGYGVVRSYNIEAGDDFVTSYEGHTGNVTAIGYGANGSFLYSCGEDQTARIWDLRAGGGQQYMFKNRSFINAACLHPSGTELILGDSAGRLIIWDLVANRKSAVMEVPGKRGITSIDISKRGTSMAAASMYQGTVYIFGSAEEKSPSDENLGSFSLIQTIIPHDGSYVPKVAFSPVIQLLVTTSADSSIGVWGSFHYESVYHDMASGPAAATANTITASNTNANATNNLLASPSTIGTTLVNEIPPLRLNFPTELTSVVEPSSSSLIKRGNSDDSNVSFFNQGIGLANGIVQSDLPPYWNGEWSSTFSKLGSLVGHKRWVWDAAFSLDGRHLVTGSSDSTARLWDIKAGIEILSYLGTHTKPITAVLLLDSPSTYIPELSEHPEECFEDD